MKKAWYVERIRLEYNVVYTDDCGGQHNILSTHPRAAAAWGAAENAAKEISLAARLTPLPGEMHKPGDGCIHSCWLVEIEDENETTD